MNATAALYVHIPFCIRRCHYCDFASSSYNSDYVASYLTALSEELTLRSQRAVPRSIYVGGGTPTALQLSELESLFSILSRVDHAALEEFTVEANPGTLDIEKLDFLRNQGVNRISLGVQSFQAEGLEFLGRLHNAKQAKTAVHLCREVGFENISLDLIFGWPGQSLSCWHDDLEQAVALSPEHISCYGLTYEEGTPLTRQRDRLALQPQSPEEERELFDLTAPCLARHGFERYEISNFSRPGFTSQHNQVYWLGGDYLGIGASACSYRNGCREGNEPELERYIQRMLEEGSARKWEETLPPETSARERLVMGLRLTRGVDCRHFANTTGYDLHELLGDSLKRLLSEGWLQEEPPYLRLAEAAIPVADTIFAELI